MKHIFLKDLKNGDFVNSVYCVDFRYSNIDTPLIATNGSKYIKFSIKDNSIARNDKPAKVFFFFEKDEDIAFLKNENNRTRYYLISGKCFRADSNDIAISTTSITPANEESGIVFDRADLFPFDENVKNELLSIQGKTNIGLSHTSIESFQEDYDLVDRNTKLEYERVLGSPHDRYQVNIKIPGVEGEFNIPAYLSPTIGKLVDDGYKLDITVSEILAKNEEKGHNAGIRVTIKAYR